MAERMPAGDSGAWRLLRTYGAKAKAIVVESFRHPTRDAEIQVFEGGKVEVVPLNPPTVGPSGEPPTAVPPDGPPRADPPAPTQRGQQKAVTIGEAPRIGRPDEGGPRIRRPDEGGPRIKRPGKPSAPTTT